MTKEELIAEAREYADAIQGGENENWMRLVTHVDALADALAASAAMVARATAETQELTRQGYPTGVLLRILAEGYAPNPSRADVVPERSTSVNLPDLTDPAVVRAIREDATRVTRAEQAARRKREGKRW